MLIDTHTHIDAAEFDEDCDAVVDAAQRAGVASIIVLGIDASNFGKVRGLAHRLPGVSYGLGIHPLFVDGSREEDLDLLRKEIEASLGDPSFVGLGEIGLDHFVPGLDRERQLAFFTAQLQLARDFELPVILHVRRAQDHILKQLRRYRPASGIAHAFNGSEQQANQFLGLGFALGFGGAMTYTHARQIRRLAAGLPQEAIVLETDAPDIPPAWLDGERNTPAELPRIARELAALRAVSVDEVLRFTAQNALRVLPRLAATLSGRGAVAAEGTVRAPLRTTGGAAERP
jgi:TatD DNase family protein